ncbi:hypothetical protein J6590_007170 [Homalodisca vitripennis]|nr:hypothetical protein J6590_007170 [Homalodisca vitripennis]
MVLVMVAAVLGAPPHTEVNRETTQDLETSEWFYKGFKFPWWGWGGWGGWGGLGGGLGGGFGGPGGLGYGGYGPWPYR